MDFTFAEAGGLTNIVPNGCILEKALIRTFNTSTDVKNLKLYPCSFVFCFGFKQRTAYYVTGDESEQLPSYLKLRSLHSSSSLALLGLDIRPYLSGVSYYGAHVYRITCFITNDGGISNQNKITPRRA
jgi:hypothetical protein